MDLGSAMAGDASAEPLRLAKPSFDAALSTNRAESLQTFWRDALGLPLEERLQVREGLIQYRHPVAGSVIKLNHLAAAFPEMPLSGFRGLLIARETQAGPLDLLDPDGNRVSLVPPGTLGVGQIGMWLHVRELARTRNFFRDALGLPVEDAAFGGVVRVGDSRLLLREDPAVAQDPAVHGPGWRSITLQVFDARRLYAQVLGRGGREGIAPQRLGSVARFAFVRDPDGNWIELSQRASLTGPIGDDDLSPAR
jgi:catechol 2,3-dioxygenase-like lactoylglutathione lyase family enzyme